MAETKRGVIRVGIGGWTFAPWRKSFYPGDLPQRRELEYASRHLTSIEINGTFYGSQKPETFAKWRDETPEDFVFSVKGPRFATNRKALGEAGSSIERFFDSGVLELGPKLGPINWQLMPTKSFDPVEIEAFLKLLPTSIGGRTIRNVLEVRHASFRCPAFVDLMQKFEIAVVVAGDSKHPLVSDVTAPFVYARLMGSQESEEVGYAPAEIDRWADRIKAWGAGGQPDGLENVKQNASKGKPRDVFVYLIAGFKLRNPRAALALLERLT